MQGYDVDQAVRSIAGKMDRKLYPDFAEQFDAIIRRAVELDLQFMRESGAIGADNMAGDSYYDDDEAYEFIVDAIVKERGWDEEKALHLCALIDDYMDEQEAYMQSVGLLDWE